jgi:hypothetical protein
VLGVAPSHPRNVFVSSVERRLAVAIAIEDVTERRVCSQLTSSGGQGARNVVDGSHGSGNPMGR